MPYDLKAAMVRYEEDHPTCQVQGQGIAKAALFRLLGHVQGTYVTYAAESAQNLDDLKTETVEPGLTISGGTVKGEYAVYNCKGKKILVAGLEETKGFVVQEIRDMLSEVQFPPITPSVLCDELTFYIVGEGKEVKLTVHDRLTALFAGIYAGIQEEYFKDRQEIFYLKTEEGFGPTVGLASKMGKIPKEVETKYYAGFPKFFNQRVNAVEKYRKKVEKDPEFGSKKHQKRYWNDGKITEEATKRNEQGKVKRAKHRGDINKVALKSNQKLKEFVANMHMDPEELQEFNEQLVCPMNPTKFPVYQRLNQTCYKTVTVDDGSHLELSVREAMERSSRFNVLYTAIGREFLGENVTPRALEEINNTAKNHHRFDMSNAFFIRVASLQSCQDAGGGPDFHTTDERDTKSVENFVQAYGLKEFEEKPLYGKDYKKGAGVGGFSEEDRKNIETKTEEFKMKGEDGETAREAAKRAVRLEHEAVTGGEVYLAWLVK